MKNKSATLQTILGGALLLLFVLFTVLVMTVDVAPIGPNGSNVGLSTINGTFHESFGYSSLFTTVSEILGFLAWIAPLLFCLLGFLQLLKRRSLRKVDADIYVLAGAYVVMIAAYVFFEVFVVNSRPILEEGILEASYPSSHTLLSLVLYGTALRHISLRIPTRPLRYALLIVVIVLLLGTVTCRLLAGVHWITDIVGGVLLGASIVCLCNGISAFFAKKGN